jgi:DNA-binding transcriptional ArsR family regulator
MDEMKAGVSPEGKINDNTPDLPPEYCRYRDEGCDLSGSCLNCPFPNCVYEESGGRQRWVKKLRAREMARLFTTKGKSVKELALIFGVSQRTVQRALKVALGDSVKRGQPGLCYFSGERSQSRANFCSGSL